MNGRMKLLVLSSLFGASISVPPAFAQDWCPPVNAGPAVNSGFQENYPTISPDGLAMYFDSNRPGGFGEIDFWVSRRATPSSPWGPAVNLGPVINSSGMEKGLVTFTPDGLTMYFSSTREGGFGNLDIYVSHRSDPDDDFNWSPPENLGPATNTLFHDVPNTIEVNGNGSKMKRLLFVRNDGIADSSPAHLENFDVYSIKLKEHGAENEELIPELNTPYRETAFTISPNQLEIFFASSRPPNVGGLDLWSSDRASVDDPWNPPVPLGPALNHAGRDETGTIDPSDFTGQHALHLLESSWRPRPSGHLRHDPNVPVAWPQLICTMGAGFFAEEAAAPTC